MEPQYHDGDRLVGDKTQKPEPGDVVIIHFERTAGLRYGMPGWVKRLVIGLPPAGFDGIVVVEQINPPRQYCVPSQHIAAMHKCVGTAIPQGDGTALFRRRQEA